jgi:hypothetical protein
MKKFLLSLIITAIFGISSTISSLDLFYHSTKIDDNISGINDEKFTDTENEYFLNKIKFENSHSSKF